MQAFPLALLYSQSRLKQAGWAGKAEKPNAEAGLGNDCQRGAVLTNTKAAAGLGSNSEEQAMQRQQQAGVI